MSKEEMSQTVKQMEQREKVTYNTETDFSPHPSVPQVRDPFCIQSLREQPQVLGREHTHTQLPTGKHLTYYAVIDNSLPH